MRSVMPIGDCPPH